MHFKDLESSDKLVAGQNLVFQELLKSCLLSIVEEKLQEVRNMKKDIHPEYVEAKVVCSCGETFETRSTTPLLKIEICSKCHPFYSGKQKLVDSGGRVERFQRRHGLKVSKPKESEPEESPEESQ